MIRCWACRRSRDRSSAMLVSAPVPGRGRAHIDSAKARIASMTEIAVSRRKFQAMKSVPFVRHVPRTVDEAVAMLAEFGPEGRTRARGRTESRSDHGVPHGAAGSSRRHQRGRRTRAGIAGRRYAVDRRRCPPRGVSSSGRGRDTWAGCSPPSCATSRIIRSGCAARSAAASRMPIPASEWCLVAATLGGADGGDQQRADSGSSRPSDFFEGIMTTALAEDEILTEVRLPIDFRPDPLRLP